MTNEALVEKAKEAMRFSYSPYSHCRVGAALLSKDGELVFDYNITPYDYGVDGEYITLSNLKSGILLSCHHVMKL